MGSLPTSVSALDYLYCISCCGYTDSLACLNPLWLSACVWPQNSPSALSELIFPLLFFAAAGSVMTSSRQLALAKFLKKAKSAKEGGDAIASDVPTVASLPTPPPSASPPPIAAVPLAMASTPAPACPNKGKRVLVIDSDSGDSGPALVSHKRRATGLPASPAAFPGGGSSQGRSSKCYITSTSTSPRGTRRKD